MHVYFNNNSSTQGEPLMDLFNKAAGSCSCGASKELSHTQAQPAAWVLLCPWLGDWDCTGLYQQDCVLLSIPNHVLCSTVSIMLKLQIANMVLGSLISQVQPKYMQRCSFSPTSRAGISNSPTAHGFPALLIGFGLLTCFHYLTQSLYQLTAKSRNQPRKSPHIIFDSTSL